MAHKSKKKHIKHVHQHDHDASEAKHPGAKATAAAFGAATSRKVRLTSKAKEAMRSTRARAAKLGAKPVAQPTAKAAAKRQGIVRSIASAATEKLTAKPKRMISKARARVRSLLHRGSAKAA